MKAKNWRGSRSGTVTIRGDLVGKRPRTTTVGLNYPAYALLRRTRHGEERRLGANVFDQQVNIRRRGKGREIQHRPLDNRIRAGRKSRVRGAGRIHFV